MSALDIIAFAFGAAGLSLAAWLYRMVRKWMVQCGRTEITVGYKRRVQLRASLTELLTWASALEAQDATGRVLYRARDVSVAVIRPRKVGKLRAAVLRARGARERRRTPSEGAPVQPATRPR